MTERNLRIAASALALPEEDLRLLMNLACLRLEGWAPDEVLKLFEDTNAAGSTEEGRRLMKEAFARKDKPRFVTCERQSQNTCEPALGA
jgi:hypothetical protein